jgi:hypothetical protein
MCGVPSFALTETTGKQLAWMDRASDDRDGGGEVIHYQETM